MKLSWKKIARHALTALSSCSIMLAVVLLCAMIPLHVRSAHSAEYEGDLLKAKVYWVEAFATGGIALVVFLIWLICAWRTQKEKRAHLAVLNRMHAAIISDHNEMIRTARDDGWPADDIKTLVLMRDAFAERHRQFLEENK